MIKKIIVNFKELPKPVKLTTIGYFTCLFGYNIYGTYIDSKTYLEKFREGNLTTIDRFNRYDIEMIKNDWDAVKYGANSHCSERLWDSIIWPITLITNIIPATVLALNPPSIQSPPSTENKQ